MPDFTLGTVAHMARPRWQQEGQEPDYRFSLANERTFLAWIRTALALLAGGVLLEQFATNMEPRIAVVALAVALATVAAALSAGAYARWRANEIAMRHARPLPANPVIPLLSMALLLVGAAIALLLLIR
jgi:putative membrane protein